MVVSSVPESPPGMAPFERALAEVRRVIVGQDRMLERVMCCVLAGGHVLLEGVPGVGKTMTLATLAKVVGGSFGRIQFTADLLPSDIVGTRVYRSSSEAFEFESGPVFVNFLLADEINRAPAKVQSALLEVMAERQVTVGGETLAVPTPFMVMATQNPLENEGVFPLPEAQRDRFMMRVNVPLPSATEEREIVARQRAIPAAVAEVLSIDQLIAAMAMVGQVTVPPAVEDYMVRLTMATREPSAAAIPELEGFIAAGASPRATIALDRASRALALMRGRTYSTSQDVYDVAYDVLNHRISLSFDATAQGMRAHDVVAMVLSRVPAAPGS